METERRRVQVESWKRLPSTTLRVLIEDTQYRIQHNDPPDGSFRRYGDGWKAQCLKDLDAYRAELASRGE
jgi:hypothetical protein